MSEPQKTSEQKWTYADYYSCTDGNRCELIDGVRYDIISTMYGPADRVEVPLLGDFVIDLADVFAESTN